MLWRIRLFVTRALCRILERIFEHFAKSRFGWEKICPTVAAAYYIVDADFKWEHRAVLASSLIHRDSVRGQLYELRRSLHRLEKGLHAESRRSVFANNYIGKTVGMYQTVLSAYHGGAVEYEQDLIWAKTVLDAYFGAVGDDSSIASAFLQYTRLEPQSVGLSLSNQIDASHTKPTQAMADDFLALVRQRHSTRSFLKRPVPHGIIREAISAAILSPSACNRQAYTFMVYDDRHLIEKIIPIPIGLTGFGDYIPCIVVVVGHLEAYSRPRDRHLIYVDCSLATMTFILTLQAHGIDSCVLNWPEIDVREGELANVLSLSRTTRPVLLLAVGYANRNVPPAHSERRSLEQLYLINSRQPTAD